jgi:2,3-bisphosphoglycerate-independent phosphoglycerate mutase
VKYIHPIALVILDGFGYSTEKKYNAIAHAKMPHFNQWWQQYPHAIIKAAGRAVGLPDNWIGNSEVGHFTIGAGCIVQQPMTVWLDSIADGSFMHNKVMLDGFKRLVDAGGTLHIMGLLSDAGVHAHEKQIYASISAAVNAGIRKIIVHPFLDGRDVAPRSAYKYLENLSHYIEQYNNHNNNRVIIGSIHGRFYAMDRDHNWDRIEKSYRVLTEKQDGPYETWQKVLEYYYAQNVTDEFIPPTSLNSEAHIHNGDGILFCNVRPDRARELTRCFMPYYAPPFILKPLNLTFFMTPVVYDEHFSTIVLFPRKPVLHTLKDVLAEHKKTIFTIAETEKYAHVTYFFRGENEETVVTETCVMINSISAQNYVNNPCMSAREITQAVLNVLHSNKYDFYVINYANADMVGHSGDFDATVKAIEFLDVQLKLLYDTLVQKMDGTLYITADHGKAEQMYNAETGQPQTAHTNNPVPFLMIKKEYKNSDISLTIKELSQVASLILNNMGIPIPNEMQQ